MPNNVEVYIKQMFKSIIEYPGMYGDDSSVESVVYCILSIYHINNGLSEEDMRLKIQNSFKKHCKGSLTLSSSYNHEEFMNKIKLIIEENFE